MAVQRNGPSRNGLSTALDGVNVLDCSRVLAGPWAAQTLADLGADVLKIEDPAAGDETRQWGPPFFDEARGLSAYFLACNRNKRGITLNLRAEAGRSLLHRLAATSDILIHNYRADSARRLGVDAKALFAVNPRLVIVAITGFGDGPRWGARPGYDFSVQALSGFMASTGPKEGPPSKVGVAVVDVLTGAHAALAAVAALRARDQSGVGLAVDIALIDVAAAGMANLAQAFLTDGKTPARQGNAHAQIVPYELFRTQDGWLVLAVGNDTQWQKFCVVANEPALESDVRFHTNPARVAARQTLIPLLVPVLASRPTAAWRAALDREGIANAPVLDLGELFASDLAEERRLKITARGADGRTVDLVRSPLLTEQMSASMPPAKGEHTDAVLGTRLGLDATQLARLRRDGVI